MAAAAKIIGQNSFKYDRIDTDTITVERSAFGQGKSENITFSQAYAELAEWFDRDLLSYEFNSDLGFSDALFEAFLSGAEIKTRKAVYKAGAN